MLGMCSKYADHSKKGGPVRRSQVRKGGNETNMPKKVLQKIK